MGELRVSTDAQEVLAANGLGSCVGVAVHDPVNRVAGLAHVQLPSVSTGTARVSVGTACADLAIPRLLELMNTRGGDAGHYRWALVGGATTENMGMFRIGERNIRACRSLLTRHGVNLTEVSERVGGTGWRTASLEIGTGRLVVISPEGPEEVWAGVAATSTSGDQRAPRGASFETRLRVGEMKLTKDPCEILTSPALASGMGVLTYDRDSGVAGMALVRLPRTLDGTSATLRSAACADYAVPRLVELLQKRGGDPTMARFALVGGAATEMDTVFQVGPQNLEACRRLLFEHGVPNSHVTERVGGTEWRAIKLDAYAGRLLVLSPSGREEEVWRG